MSTEGLLGLGMGLANLPAAVTQGKAAGRAQAYQEVGMQEDLETRKLNRQIAMQRKQQGEMELARMQKLEPVQTDALQQALQVQNMQLQQQGTQMFQNTTYQALDKYMEDFNVRHLNSFVQQAKQNPYAPQAFKDIVRIDKLDQNSQETKRLLADLGLTDEQLDEMDGTRDGQVDWEALSQRFVVTTMPDGTKGVRDVYRLGIFTGYAEYADDKKLSRLERLAKLQKGSGGSAYKEPTSVTEANRLAEARTRVEAGNATEEDYAFIEMMEAEMGGTKSVQSRKAEEARREFYEKDYISLPVEQLRDETTPEGAHAMALVRSIEEQMPLDKDDKEVIRDAYRNISSLSRAVNLDPETRGFIDAPWAKLKTYFTEQGAEGREASAAYNSFINQIRNDLFGSALTEKEIEMFNKAYGTDKQAMTVALSGMYELADAIDQSLEATAILNDPIVIKARFGRTQPEIAQAKQNIKARIRFFETYEQERNKGKSEKQAREVAIQAAGIDLGEGGKVPNQTTVTPPEPEAEPKKTKTLNEIFGGL